MISKTHQRNTKLKSDDFSSVYKGEDVLEYKIKSIEKSDNRLFNLIINGHLLLRIEKKRKGKSTSRFLNTEFIKRFTSIKDLASSQKNSILKNILEHDRFIKNEINAEVNKGSHTREKFMDFYAILERRWQNIEDLQAKLKLNLLRNDSYGYCPNCCALRSGGSFKKLKKTPIPGEEKQECHICRKEIKQNKTIKCLPDPLADYITGTWFEDYIAEKLEKIGWKVWPQIYVYGSSGAKFEIDVLATKMGYTLLVECKNKNVDMADISKFLAKFSDIKTHMALFVATTAVDAQFKTMVEKNPSFRLIDNISSDVRLNARLKKIIKL